jgi:hypothetical protein
MANGTGVTDTAGNALSTANLLFAGQAYTYDTTAPTITSVTTGHAAGMNTQGKLEQNDTITVVFSESMKVSNFCSAWTTGDSSDQSLSGSSGGVVVTINDGTGTTNDSLTLTSTACTFNFGTVDLGSNAYVSGGNVSFGTSGSNFSIINWTASTHTLVITLGKQVTGGGTVGSVSSSALKYTASTSITDSAGNTVGNSPFTTAVGAQF